MRLEEELRCSGLMGFGTGYTLGKANTPFTQSISGKDSYCASCPLANQCWGRHRQKAQFLMPEASVLFDELQRRHGQEKAMRLWQETARKKNAAHPHMAAKLPEQDPYLLLMFQNIDDGYTYARTGKVKDRGPYTIKLKMEETDA